MKQPPLFRHSGLKPALQEAFTAFWAAYPARRPNPRAMAEAEFARLCAAGLEPQRLVEAARLYAAECRAKAVGEAFIVHARTFLAQRRFEDYGPAAPVPAAEAAAEPDDALWQALKGRLSLAEYRAWLKPLRLLASTEGERALLVAPTRFHRDHVRQHFASALRVGLGVRVVDIDIAEDVQP